MRRGDRLLLYPPKLLAFCGVTFALALAIELAAYDIAGGQRAVAACVTHGPVRPPAAMIALCAMAVVCGNYRATVYDPLANSGYRRWLATTPWRPPQPLPLGPAHLVARDLIVLVPLGLLGYATGVGPLLPIRWFLGAYVVCLGVSLATRGWWRFALLLGFALALRLLAYPLALSILLVLLYAIAMGGLRAALRLLPYPDANAPKPPDRSLGWPFDALAPHPPTARVTPAHAALYSLLAGAWVYALTDRLPPPDLGWATWAVIVGFVTAAIRMMIYWCAVQPAMAQRYRFANGRWRNFTNNRMYLGPALILVAACALPAALRHTPLSAAAGGGICAAVFLFLAIATGPTLANWRLTAHGRLTFGPEDGRAKYVGAA